MGLLSMVGLGSKGGGANIQRFTPQTFDQKYETGQSQAIANQAKAANAPVVESKYNQLARGISSDRFGQQMGGLAGKVASSFNPQYQQTDTGNTGRSAMQGIAGASAMGANPALQYQGMATKGLSDNLSDNSAYKHQMQMGMPSSYLGLGATQKLRLDQENAAEAAYQQAIAAKNAGGGGLLGKVGKLFS
jgi:hypothetical protein